MIRTALTWLWRSGDITEVSLSIIGLVSLSGIVAQIVMGV